MVSSLALSMPTGATTNLPRDALAAADPAWLAGLITRRVSIDHWSDAYIHHPDDIKTTLQFGDDTAAQAGCDRPSPCRWPSVH